ncbi:MAG: hypothetical protein FWD57_06440 [Polyangiaceae bacterium]|nr:hypothetical protein [Polyangiaceae bacterium]
MTRLCRWFAVGFCLVQLCSCCGGKDDESPGRTSSVPFVLEAMTISPRAVKPPAVPTKEVGARFGGEPRPGKKTTALAQISVGGGHACARTVGGRALCWGSNDHGQIGNGSYGNRNTPATVSGLSSGVTSIAAGRRHACAIVSDGTVKCWGSNEFGQLGDNSTDNSSVPTITTGLGSGVTAIAAGFEHTCAITWAGVMCWGSNQYGQIGVGPNGSKIVPMLVDGLGSGVSAIATGAYFTCAIRASDDLVCWGSNQFGEMGKSSRVVRNMPASVSGLGGLLSTVSGGGNHTCVLDAVGAVYCWGANQNGQLGIGTGENEDAPKRLYALSRTTAISAGMGHACAINAGGGLLCWGGNKRGQVGDNTTMLRSVPTDVVGLKSGVVSVSAGSASTCVITTSGAAKCWGLNEDGRLGDGTYESSQVPVSVKWDPDGQ